MSDSFLTGWERVIKDSPRAMDINSDDAKEWSMLMALTSAQEAEIVKLKATIRNLEIQVHEAKEEADHWYQLVGSADHCLFPFRLGEPNA